MIRRRGASSSASGVTALGSVGGAANAAGGAVSGSTLTLAPQSAAFPGLLDPIAGLKTATTDSSGTPGDATANTPRGIAAIPGDSTTLQVVITNSLVTTASTVLCIPQGSGGANLRSFQVSKAAGSFTFRINAVVASTLKFDWHVIN